MTGGYRLVKYLKLMRIKHWLKNVLVFAALVFGGKLFSLKEFYNCCIAFLVFSLAASCVYIINDMEDVEKDRRHPTKCKRPLASGEISLGTAKILLIILLLSVFVLNYFLLNTILSWGGILIYILLNLFYSKYGKNIALLDVTILVIGYVLRVYYGAMAIDVEVSGWLYLTITFIAFYLGLGKRRNELQQLGKESRKVLKYYSKEFLDKNMYMFLGLTIMCYACWCENVNSYRGNGKMLLTVPIVVLICMRYSLDIESNKSDGDPMNVILQDKILFILALFYIIIIVGILYFL